MVSDAIVCMCVKLESAFYGHTSAAELFQKIASVAKTSWIENFLCLSPFARLHDRTWKQFSGATASSYRSTN